MTGIFAAMAFGLGTRAASAQCRIEVKQARLKDVVVTVPGVTFSLDLDRVPLTIELERGKANASLQVMAPLRFSASYPTDKLAFQIKGRIDLYGGRLRLGKAAAHAWLGVRGDGMQLSLLSTLGIEMKEPLQIPCSHIALGDGTPYRPPEVVWPRKDRTTGMGPAFFPLYLGPQEADPLSIRYPGPMRILGRRQGWVRIQAAWHDGSKVTGWTLERNMTEEVVPVGGAEGGQSHDGGCHGVVDGPLLEKRTLLKGAPVAASPEGPVWAWVTRTITVDAVYSDRSDGWIRVIGLPGFVRNPCSAYEVWVHTRDILAAKAPSGKSH